MRQLTALIRRELIAYFSSPLAYIVMAVFLLMQGYIFWMIVSFLNNPVTEAMTPLQLFFGYQNIFFWIFMLFVVPVITMRLVAEERRSGTIEVLLTAPLSEAQVIAGKFLAALCFYGSLWVPTILYPLMLNHYSAIDFGPVLSGYLGLFVVGFALLGIGVFASTLTNNQLIAAILSFAMMIFLFLIILVEQLIPSSSMLKPVLGHMNMVAQIDDFARGIVDSRHIIYQLSLGLVFLFLATKSLEVKKWR